MTKFSISLLVLFLLIVPLTLASCSFDTFEEDGNSSQVSPTTQKTTILGSSEKGGLAFNLNLEVQNGSGRVFFYSGDFSDTDTAVSMELGKEIACREFNFKCNNNNFFFNIESQNIKTKGPSAGAASSILTAAIINEDTLNPKTSITGTIIAGGLIGPVGGIKDKIDGASERNITKVLIPYGYAMDENQNINLTEYGANFGVEVVEVRNIFEAYSEFTGTPIHSASSTFTVNTKYTELMEGFSKDLCDRAQAVSEEIDQTKLNGEQKQQYDLVKGSIKQGMASRLQSKYYASASHCFQATSTLNYLDLASQNLPDSELRDRFSTLDQDITEFSYSLPLYNTINDFQVNNIVKERIRDASKKLNESLNLFVNGDKNQSLLLLSQSEERLKTAKEWTRFFGLEGEEFSPNQETLKNSCINSIDFAERKKAYLDSLSTNNLPDIINEQYFDLKSNSIELLSEGEFGLCLYETNKLNAKVNEISTRLLTPEKDLDRIVKGKLDSVKRTIFLEEQKGNFPIIGYSHLEFSEQLVNSDVLRSLAFAESALVFSDLDAYQSSSPDYLLESQTVDNVYTILGIVIGALAIITLISLISFITERKIHHPKKPRNKKKR